MRTIVTHTSDVNELDGPLPVTWFPLEFRGAEPQPGLDSLGELSLSPPLLDGQQSGRTSPIPSTPMPPQPAGLAGGQAPSSQQPSEQPRSSPPRKRQSLWQRLGLGRLIRRLVALALVGLALWWFALPLFFPVTNQAVVNARLVQIRAPIDGTPVELSRDLGENVAAHETLVRMVNPRADTAPLSNLKSRLGELTARRSALIQELQKVSQSQAACRNTCQSYQRSRIAFLQRGVEQCEAALHISRVQHENAEKEWQRLDYLTRRSAAAASDMDKAIEVKGVARRRIEVEQAALAKARTELEAARQGVYVSLETPSFLGRAEELALRIPLLRNSLQETEQHLAVVKQEVERERRRIDSLSQGVAASPVSGVVWKRYGNLGQATHRTRSCTKSRMPARSSWKLCCISATWRPSSPTVEPPSG